MSDDEVFADRPSNRTEPPDIDPVELLARSVTEGPPPTGSHDFYAGRCVRCDLRVADAGYTCSGFAVAPTDLAAALVEARTRIERLEADRAAQGIHVAALLASNLGLKVALRWAATELDGSHYLAPDSDPRRPVCALCYPGESRWPCVSKQVADDLRAALDGEGTS